MVTQLNIKTQFLSILNYFILYYGDEYCDMCIVSKSVGKEYLNLKNLYL